MIFNSFRFRLVELFFNNILCDLDLADDVKLKIIISKCKLLFCIYLKVLIKNHHKNKKSKIIEEEVPKKSKSSINIDNSTVLVDDTKTTKEVQFQV